LFFQGQRAKRGGEKRIIKHLGRPFLVLPHASLEYSEVTSMLAYAMHAPIILLLYYFYINKNTNLPLIPLDNYQKHQDKSTNRPQERRLFKKKKIKGKIVIILCLKK
jgi:hypothetical protein